MNELTELQFLRPYWLLALLPVIWLLWKAWQIKQKQGAWHQVIAPQFQSLLLGESAHKPHTQNHQLGLIGLSFIWLIAILSLAGPSTQSVEIPAHKNQQGTVIVLDLSLSMLADDISPNRLTRVKYKLTDLLTQHPEIAIGLVGYSGSAHTISPISEDNKTLLSILPDLNPVVMPRYGSEPLLGFQKADELFKGAHINHGHIIWITDDIEPHQVTTLKPWIKQHGYSVSILAVGTAIGGAVQIPNHGLLKDDNGKIISPPLPFERFNAFTKQNNVTLNPFNISDQSLKSILPPMLPAAHSKKTAKTDDTRMVLPLDQGVYLLFLLVPLVALLFRRGWVLGLSAMSFPLVGLLAASFISVGLFAPNTSYAETDLPSLSDAFKTPDQLGYQAWQENNLQAAESLFENPQWRASSLYKQGKYQEAAELFRQDNSAKGFYNLGNALAKNGELKAAKEAYETALKKQPEFSQAQQNLPLVKQLLAQQKEQEQKNQPSNQSQDKNSSEPKEEKNEEDSPDSDSKETNKSENSSDSNQEGEQNSEKDTDKHENGDENPSKNNLAPESETQENQSDEHPTGDLENEAVPQPSEQEGSQEEEKLDNDSVQDSESTDAHQEQTERNAGKLDDQTDDATPNDLQSAKTQLSPKEQEQKQAMKNWLKQIPDEPGLFLKLKFEHQYQQQSNQPKSAQDSKQW